MNDDENKVRELPVRKVKPDANVIATLRELLGQAERGELHGLVAFTVHSGDTVGFFEAGEKDTGEILLAFEFWKLRQIARRPGLVP